MFHKVVSSLPDPLDNDSVYFVRAGSGFDVYVTNHNGGLISAYPLNASASGSGSLPGVEIDCGTFDEDTADIDCGSFI